MNYTIEKNVPLAPKRSGRRGLKYPVDQMDVGDSFAVPLLKPKNRWNQHPEQTAIGRAIIEWKKRNAPDKQFTVRKVDENTLRVWRVA